ncbi:MAG: cytochrome c oxidase subunit II [Nitrospirae bacterium]|nr:cytochrome c oxidase subunit II [Nitrospirota bacterium]
MNSAQTVDNVFLVIVAVSVALLAAVVVTMLFFVVRYRRSRNPEPENIEGSLFLEIIWVVIPLMIVISIFLYGWKGFRFMRAVPPNALPVKAFGMMWSWSFEYESGRMSNELVVPAGRPVKLIITSRDVLHSLFIPAFRIKEDAVPGMQTHLWFLPDKTGQYDLFCSEYCGEGHSSMITKVRVLPAEDFRKWYKEGRVREAATGSKGGAELLKGKGCLVCHSTDGSRKWGPTFKGLFESRVTVLTAGKKREIIADEEYLRRSVTAPQADIVMGFPPVMPQETDNVSEEELSAIIEHIKGLK